MERKVVRRDLDEPQARASLELLAKQSQNHGRELQKAIEAGDTEAVDEALFWIVGNGRAAKTWRDHWDRDE